MTTHKVLCTKANLFDICKKCKHATPHEEDWCHVPTLCSFLERETRGVQVECFPVEEEGKDVLCAPAEVKKKEMTQPYAFSTFVNMSYAKSLQAASKETQNKQGIILNYVESTIIVKASVGKSNTKISFGSLDFTSADLLLVAGILVQKGFSVSWNEVAAILSVGWGPDV